jgi:hypothetical protein
VVQDQNGAAAVVTLRNVSSRPLRDVPVAISVRDAHGGTLFQNNAPGLQNALVSASLLEPHRELTWIEDQVPPAGRPASVSARVGQAQTASDPPPRLEVTGVHLVDDPASGVGAAGAVVNHSKIPQQSLVVFGVARRAGRIVAAGRAVLPEVPAGSSSPFQIFFVGDPRGARLQLSAPPTTL